MKFCSLALVFLLWSAQLVYAARVQPNHGDGGAENAADLPRFARDGKAYTLQEFKSYYPDTWAAEWTLSPPVDSQPTISEDGNAYTVKECVAFYKGEDWRNYWKIDWEGRRYANNLGLYDRNKFRDLYSDWRAQWVLSPQERRVARDQRAYTLTEFKQYWPSDYEGKWQDAKLEQMTGVAGDGQTYSIVKFKDYYGKEDWRAYWKISKESRKYAEDGMLYTLVEFMNYYSDQAKWKAAPHEKRVAEDKNAYTMKEFYTFKYATDFAWKWNFAETAPCQECR